MGCCFPNSWQEKAMDNGLIKEVAENYGVDADLIKTLLAYEQTRVHLDKRRGAKDQLRTLIEEADERDKEA